MRMVRKNCRKKDKERNRRIQKKRKEERNKEIVIE